METKGNFKFSFIAHLIGAVLTIISVFLPAVNVMGIEYSMMDGPTGSGVGIFFIILAVIIAVVGIVKKRWLHILSLILALVITGLAGLYLGDAEGFIGIGLWFMFFGGLISLIGSILGLMKK